MPISLVRIDERLIHGQVAYSWSVAYQIDRIVVVDDEAAQDDIQRMLLEMATPTGKGFSLFTVDEACRYLSDNPSERLFIVVRSASTILTMVQKGIPIREVNVGGIYYKEGRKMISKTVYLSPEEQASMLALKDLGVACEIRTAPGDKPLNLFDKI